MSHEVKEVKSVNCVLISLALRRTFDLLSLLLLLSHLLPFFLSSGRARSSINLNPLVFLPNSKKNSNRPLF